MREKEFHLLLSCALCVERRSREVYLYEASAFGSTDSVQSSLPFYFFGLSVSLYLVYVMRLVVDNHQVFQSGKVLQFVAAQCSAVEHTEVVARCFARAHRQQCVHYFCWSNSVRVVIVVFILVCCLVLKEVPVGKSYQAFASGFLAYAVLFRHHIVLYEREHLVAIALRYEHILVEIVVVGLRVAVFCVSFLSAAEGVEQTVVHNKSGRYNQKLLCEASALLVFVACVQHLPYQQGVHHPCLARASSHLHGILRHLVFRFGELCQVCMVH